MGNGSVDTRLVESWLHYKTRKENSLLGTISLLSSFPKAFFGKVKDSGGWHGTSGSFQMLHQSLSHVRVRLSEANSLSAVQLCRVTVPAHLAHLVDYTHLQSTHKKWSGHSWSGWSTAAASVLGSMILSGIEKPLFSVKCSTQVFPL